MDETKCAHIYQFFYSEHNVTLHQAYSLKDKQNKWAQTADNLTHSGRDHVEYSDTSANEDNSFRNHIR